jgi:cell division protein FtsZ
MVVAEEGIEALRDKLDTLIVIPNQKLLDIVDKKMTLIDAFKLVDSILGQGVKGIADLITTPGLINVDFADVKTIMNKAGNTLMGMGIGMGENRAQIAARNAITSPLLEISIEGAKGILFNITGGSNLTMNEVNEAAEIITAAADADANIIFGTVIDESLSDQIKITVIATGFDEARQRLSQISLSRPIRPQVVNRITKPAPIVNNKAAEENPPEEKRKYDDGIPPEETEFDVPAFLRQGRN